MRKISLSGILLVLLLISTLVCLGDTIYLKNGKKIKTSYAKIQEDKLIFRKYGGMITIPISLVDRITDDNYLEPKKSTIKYTSTSQSNVQQDKGMFEEDEQSGGQQGKKNPQYWLKLREDLNKRLAEKEKELSETQRAMVGLMNAGAVGRESVAARIKALEDEIAQLKTQLANLEDEARKSGIQPGVFRQ